MFFSDAAHQLHVDIIAHVQLLEEIACVFADCTAAEARCVADLDFLEERDLAVIDFFTDLVDQDEFLLQATQRSLILIHERL